MSLLENKSNLKKRIPYGISQYEKIKREHYYYVDRTAYIEYFESLGETTLFFIRPRRFGKSLFVSMLENYYDVYTKDDFEILFRHTYIGAHPTPLKNSYYVLNLDFSGINTSNHELLYDSFGDSVRRQMLKFIDKYEDEFRDLEYYRQFLQHKSDPSSMIGILLNLASKRKVYILVDEYDNFANALISQKNSATYRTILHNTGFVKAFYAEIKALTTSVVSRIFITGVSPLMMSDLTSGFNIAAYKTLSPKFNELLGLTRDEVRELIEYYLDFEDEQKREEIFNRLVALNDGYLFSRKGKERMFNIDMVLYYLREYYEEREEPHTLTDLNLMTDYTKLESLFAVEEKAKEEMVTEIIKDGRSDVILNELFQLNELESIDNFKSLLFYLGFLTIDEYIEGSRYVMKIPNEVIKRVYWELIIKLLKEKEVLKVNLTELDQIYRSLAKGDIEPFIKAVFETMKNYVSYRDMMGFEEKHLKMLWLMLLSTMSQNLIITSEQEVSEGFMDIVVTPNENIRSFFKYAYIFELKYVKAREKVTKKGEEEIKERGMAQIRRYVKDKNLENLSGGRAIKKYVILFKGKSKYLIWEG